MSEYVPNIFDKLKVHVSDLQAALKKRQIELATAASLHYGRTASARPVPPPGNHKGPIYHWEQAVPSGVFLGGNSTSQVFFDGYLVQLLAVFYCSLTSPPLEQVSKQLPDLENSTKPATLIYRTTNRLRSSEPTESSCTVQEQAVKLIYRIMDGVLRDRDYQEPVAQLQAVLGEMAKFPSSAPSSLVQMVDGLDKWREIGYAVFLDGYRVFERIGAGSFGAVYRAVSPEGHQVAIKMEAKSNCCLTTEIDAYKALKDHGFATLYMSGENSIIRYMAISLLGTSLRTEFQRCQKYFDQKSLSMIATQLITRMETIHSIGLVHRDIKPSNLLCADEIDVIDFGLARPLPEVHKRTKLPKLDKPAGTCQYMSMDSHLWQEKYPKDDMESLGYVLLYFKRGELPWRTLRTDYRKVLRAKKGIVVDTLCEDMPELGTYLKYVRSLSHKVRPDYEFMRSLFKTGMDRRGEVDDGHFCWLAEPPRKRPTGAASGSGP